MWTHSDLFSYYHREFGNREAGNYRHIYGVVWPRGDGWVAKVYDVPGGDNASEHAFPSAQAARLWVEDTADHAIQTRTALPS